MRPGGRITPMPVGRAMGPKPHIYFAAGYWCVSREGRARPLIGTGRPSFPEACHLAMLAAIHAGVWRA